MSRAVWAGWLRPDGVLSIEFVKVVLSLQSCAFRGELRKLGWLSGRLAGDLLKNQRRRFLHWSNVFLMILSSWELQWGVRLMHFAMFY